MSDPNAGAGEPVRIVLTPQQRELVKRMSGQTIDAIELSPEDGTGGALKFVWRLSEASGIPRQRWVDADDEATPKQG